MAQKTGRKFTFFELLSAVLYRFFSQIKSLYDRNRKRRGQEPDGRKR